MRILITGVAGFLGSHLADALLTEGNSVIGVDNFSTGSLANLKHLENEPRFEITETDICEPFDPGKVDYVFNFASPASPVDYSRSAVETLRVGSAGTSELPSKWRAKYKAKFPCTPPRLNVMEIRCPPRR